MAREQGFLAVRSSRARLHGAERPEVGDDFVAGGERDGRGERPRHDHVASFQSHAELAEDVGEPRDRLGEAAHAHEVVTRIRDTALRRLRKQLALTFERDQRSALIGQLARFTLAVVDGAFIAVQAGPHVKLANLTEHMPAALVAIESALSASD